MNVIKMSKMLLGQENVTFASCQPPLISVVVVALQVNLHLRALRKSDKSSFLYFWIFALQFELISDVFMAMETIMK